MTVAERPRGAAPSAPGRDRRGARRDPGPARRPRPERPRARDVHASCGASTAPTRARSRLLATLPTAGEGVVAGPGENAGVISIGDGLAVAFKIESHNHPSAVEPYQGAATGVGGILRDIFTMGARPDRRARRAAVRRSRRRAHAAPGRWGRARASADTATASACRRSAASWCSTRATRATRSSTSWPSACSKSGAHPGRRARAGQSRRAVRVDDRARRDRRCVGPRQRDVHR